MAKSKKQVTTVAAPAAVETVAAPTQPTQPEARYTVRASKRPLGTDTKHGIKSTSGTHAALMAAAAENGGVLTASQAQAICTAQGDKGFFRYAINRLKVLVPADAQ